MARGAIPIVASFPGARSIIWRVSETNARLSYRPARKDIKLVLTVVYSRERV